MNTKIRQSGTWLCLWTACMLPWGAARAQHGWTHFARSPERDGRAAVPAPVLESPAVVGSDETGAPIEWVWQSGVVSDMGHAFAQGYSRGASRLFAIDLKAASVSWSGAVPDPFFDSWSTPAIDASNSAVVIASGDNVIAFDVTTGSPRWTATLENPVVNASPLATADLGGADRVFIADFGVVGDGRLYCINADPRTGTNPFDPGEIVWSVALEGTGNTPAYLDGVVYVATSAGHVLAFDAAATSAPPPQWAFENQSGGFFGGCSVNDHSVFAATYGFSGGHLNSELIKLDRVTGAELWRTPSNRTDVTPIPLEGGRVVLSAGIAGFGSQPSVQLFREIPGGAELVWDTALDTWDDLNGNQVLDPGEFFPVGGWTHQPIVTGTSGAETLLCGVIPTSGSFFGPSTGLYSIDLRRAPGEPGFVRSDFAGAGATPALTDAGLLTIGAGGVHVFSVCYADCDQSSGPGVLDIFDFLCFQDAFINAEAYACGCDGGAGNCDIFDFICFQDRFAAGCE